MKMKRTLAIGAALALLGALSSASAGETKDKPKQTPGAVSPAEGQLRRAARPAVQVPSGGSKSNALKKPKQKPKPRKVRITPGSLRRKR